MDAVTCEVLREIMSARLPKELLREIDAQASVFENREYQDSTHASKMAMERVLSAVAANGKR